MLIIILWKSIFISNKILFVPLDFCRSLTENVRLSFNGCAPDLKCIFYKKDFFYPLLRC